MVNGKEHGVPFEKFTEEITRQGIDKRFNYEKCAKGLEAGLEENEVNFAQWLRDEVEIDCERFYGLTEDDEEFLREKYAECLENKKKWQNIHPEFTPELKSKGKSNSFNYEQTKKGINIGLKPTDAGFCAGLRDNKEIGPKKVLASEDNKKLREEYVDCLENRLEKDKERELEIAESEKEETTNAQKGLDGKYPKNKRGKIRKLAISNTIREKLKGFLKLESFIFLEELRCSYNKHLTGLDLNDCSNLRVLNCSSNSLNELVLPSNLSFIECFDCSYNKLVRLDGGVFESTQLERLIISNNNFPSQDLSFLSEFVHLKELGVSNNYFCGSLEPLKNMNKLETLDISDTDIEKGIEYLPESIKGLFCQVQKPGKEVEKVENELQPFYKSEEEDFNYDLKEGRKNTLIRVVKENKQLREENKELKKENSSLQLSIGEKEEELKMEREEAEKALEKAKEGRERQIKEITEQKDKEIKQLQDKISELEQLLQTKIEIPPK